MDGSDGAWQELGLGDGGGEPGDRLRRRDHALVIPGAAARAATGSVQCLVSRAIASGRRRGTGRITRGRSGIPPLRLVARVVPHCVIMHSLCRDCLNLLPPEPADDEDFGARLNYWLAKEACASSCKGYLDRCSGFFPDCPPIFEQFIEDLRDDLPSEPAEPETERDLSKCGADVTDEMLDFLTTLHDAIQAGVTAPGLNELVCGLYAAERLGPEGDLNWKKEGKKNPSWKCGCPRTLAICGICFDDSVPANIMYGYAGSMCMGLRSLVHSVAKRFVKSGEAWAPHDRRAVDSNT